MMNYLELINRYWQEVDIKGWTPVETEVYFRLLDYCNRIEWRNPFALPNPRALALMSISENTLDAGRKKLMSKGLIKYKKGSRRSEAPIYCFPERVDGKWVFPESFASGFTSIDAAKPEAKSEAKSEAKPAAILYSNNKTKTKTGGARAHAREDAGLFDAEEKKKSRSPKPRGKPPEPDPPTLQEVKDYFLSQSADTRVLDWEMQAELFFNHYNGLGWRNSAGGVIQRWDSFANKWLIKQESDEKNQSRGAYRQGSGQRGLRSKLPPSPGCGLVEPDD